MPGGFFWAVPSLQKHRKASLGIPGNFFDFTGCPWSVMWCNFFLTYGFSLPFGNEVNILFGFSKSLLISLLLFLSGGGFALAGYWFNYFPFWGNPGWIISLHGMKSLHWWYGILNPTEPPSLSIESINTLQLSKKNCFPSGHSIEAKLFSHWS